MYPNYIKTLLGLEDVSIEKIIPADSFIKIFVFTKPSPQICPCCHASTSKIHDYRLQEIKDIPLQLKHTILVLKKRRYVCSCGKRFYEHYDFIPRYQRITRRLSFKIIELLRHPSSLKHIAQLLNVSVSTVCRLLDTLNYTIPTLPEAISIDEFKGNASTGKYQCILVDPKKRRILDILPDRTQSHLADYLRAIPRKQRLNVRFFVCDMWKPYTELAAAFFPNASIIIDKYHFIRQVSWAIENVRKRLQRNMHPNLRRYYKRSRKLILTRYYKLKEESKQECDLMLQYSEELRLAHRMKEWFYEICQMTQYAKQRQEFDNWIANAENSGISYCIRNFI
jgi:transposase